MGVVVPMRSGLAALSQRWLWKSAGYDFLVVVIFYTLTIAGIFILRKKRPDAERPYKAFGYPLLPLIYILMGTTFCILLIIYKPDFTWPGLIITLLGIPLYYFAIQQKKATAK